MHGNEPSGRPLLLALALHLASAKGPQVEEIRNHMHTIIIPTMNPDGFKAGKRGNGCALCVLHAERKGEVGQATRESAHTSPK
jgi:murein tripeptide amidase MpaA